MRALIRTALAVSISFSLVVAQAPQPPAAQPPAPAPAPPANVGGYNLRDANLLTVIDILARDLHINYILDARVNKGATVTINTYGEVKTTDLRPILETILRMNGLAMVQVGNIYRILPTGDVSRTPIPPQANMKEFPDDERMLLNLIFLKYMTAGEMENILKPFLGEGSTMVTYAPANLLMIEDNSRNMRRTMDLINMFDSDQFAGQRVKTYGTQFSRPSDVVKELETIFKAYALSDKTAPVKFLAIDRINIVLAVASNPGVFTEVENWVKKLDVPAKLPAGAVGNYVYKLKYGRAEQIGSVIMQLYGSSGYSNVSSQYTNAGSRFNGTGYPGAFSGGGGGILGGGSFLGGGGINNNLNASGQAEAASTTPTSPLAGPFGGAAAATPSAGAAAGGAPGSATPAATDQTGRYLNNPTDAASYRGLPRIIPNPSQNSLIIQGTPQMWEQILNLLEQIDVPPRQVLIDAKIYEIDLNDTLTSDFEEKLALKDNSPRTFLGAVGSGGLNNLTAGILVGHSRQLLFALSATDSKTKAKVISAPSLIATDSIPASINVGTDIPTLSAVAPGLSVGGTTQFTQTVQNVSTGVSLNILARVNASGIVTLVIDQSVTAPVPAPAGISTPPSPSISKRDVSTQVTVQDGDTIAIGGIILESETLTANGIPGLQRIPYLGTLFGGRNFTKTRTELIIFLTPRVIYDTNQISEATEELRQKVKTLDRMTRKDQ